MSYILTYSLPLASFSLSLSLSFSLSLSSYVCCAVCFQGQEQLGADDTERVERVEVDSAGNVKGYAQFRNWLLSKEAIFWEWVGGGPFC